MIKPFHAAALLLIACGGETVTAPAPIVTTYVLATTNGRAPDVALCNITSCFQTIGDTIRLSSDSTATHVFTFRETTRTSGAIKDTPGLYRGAYSTSGATIHLESVSTDALKGTFDLTGLKLTGTYGDVYIYSRR